MVGEGIISTDGDELGGGVTPDGKTLIFEKSAAPHYLYIMCESHLVNGKWSASGNSADLRRVSRYRSGACAGWRVDFVCVGSSGRRKRFASMVDLACAARCERMERTGACAGSGEQRRKPGICVDRGEWKYLFCEFAENGRLRCISREACEWRVRRGGGLGREFQWTGDRYVRGDDCAGRELFAVGEFWAAGRSGQLGPVGELPGRRNVDQTGQFRAENQWKSTGLQSRISGDGKWLYFTSEKGFLDERREQAYTYQLLTDEFEVCRERLGKPVSGATGAGFGGGAGEIGGNSDEVRRKPGETLVRSMSGA